jgi:hypothetical protein
VGENTNQIEQEIRERRSDLGRNLDTLERKARELADWRTHYREHPAAFIGAAIGAGLMLGLLAIPRPRRRAAVDDTFGERDSSHDVYQVNGSARRGIRADAADRIKREAGETWDHIATGLLHLASAKAIQFVSERVPGFTEHAEERQPFRDRTLH